MSTSPLLYRTSKSTTLLFLSIFSAPFTSALSIELQLLFFILNYIIYLSSKEVRAKKTIHLPPKEEGVFLEILDKRFTTFIVQAFGGLSLYADKELGSPPLRRTPFQL